MGLPPHFATSRPVYHVASRVCIASMISVCRVNAICFLFDALFLMFRVVSLDLCTVLDSI